MSAPAPIGVPPAVADTIRTDLAALEERHEVRILFACESGSRAWGFASPDSDYDVRFVYVRPRDWYLGLVPGKDVIEEPITGEMDVAGWDLRKALGLLRGGNATLLEWLYSPVVYRAEPGFVEAFTALADDTYRRDRSFHHYAALAVKHLSLCQREGDIHLKQFLYALRTALAARWSATRDEPPPMRLTDLVNGVVDDASVSGDAASSEAVRAHITALVEAKSGLGEGATYQVPPGLMGYLRTLVASFRELDVPKGAPVPVEPFDAFFLAWVGSSAAHHL